MTGRTLALALAFSLGAGSAYGADDATPAERHAQGRSRVLGAARVYDATHCPPAALQKIGLTPARLVAPGTHLFRWSAQLGGTNFFHDYTATTYTDTVMVSAIDKAMGKLQRSGDRELDGRYVCAGLYDYGELNARAYSAGYILADTRLALKAKNSINDGTFVSDFPVLHELAHQFQFWTRDATLSEATMRRAELGADCVAGSLIALIHPRFLSFVESSDEAEASRLGQAFGDYSYFEKGHHGTPYERWSAVRDGIGLLKDWQARKGLKGDDYTGLSSKLLLFRCNTLIAQRDRDQGPDWKPGWRGQR